jgi:Holliday junction resolvase RusA-like endonuclease
MEFIIEYNGDEYSVALSERTNEDKIEVLRFPYGNEDGEWDECKIQVFLRLKDKPIQVKVLDLPEPLKEIITDTVAELRSRTFIANPYFDELLIFAGSEVFTYQEKLKPFDCSICYNKNLYEKRSKGNKSEYMSAIKSQMDTAKNEEWPFREKLLLQFSVSNTQSKLDEIDLDNLAKTIFDTLKGTVYVDDSQIIGFTGSKDSVLNLKAFIVAIRRLALGEKPVYQEYLYSQKRNIWQKEYDRKKVLNKSTRFMVYGNFKK